MLRTLKAIGAGAFASLALAFYAANVTLEHDMNVCKAVPAGAERTACYEDVNGVRGKFFLAVALAPLVGAAGAGALSLRRQAREKAGLAPLAK